MNSRAEKERRRVKHRQLHAEPLALRKPRQEQQPGCIVAYGGVAARLRPLLGP